MNVNKIFAFFIQSFTVIFFAFLCLACGSSKKAINDYIYFSEGWDTINAAEKETVIQSGDLITVQVYSKTLNQEQAAIFNQPVTSNGVPQGYQITTAGNIDMPVIGSIKAAGLTKYQLQNVLAQRLTDNVRNPSVLVRFLQFNVNVLGEVRSPGIQKFTVDRVTVIDALSAAGDLTDYGKRQDVTVIREENGRKIYYKIDLRNKNIFQSPVYILQPNDIVYVGPTKNKLKTLNADPDLQRKTGLILTVVSLVLTISNILVYILR